MQPKDFVLITRLVAMLSQIYMPQPVGSSGGHIGTGRALTRALAVGLAEFAMWVEATAPVTTRERAKMRAMSFMGVDLSVYIFGCNF